MALPEGETAASVAAGDRYAVPPNFFDFDGTGRGWQATVQSVENGEVVFHCDGDKKKEVTVVTVEEFVSRCSRLDMIRPAVEDGRASELCGYA